MEFSVKPAPHVIPATGVPLIMRRVLYALAPALIAYIWFFGWGIVINLVVTTAVALGAEALMLRLRNKPIRPALSDYSAVVTAVLLAFAMPPLVPWWLPAVGAVAAIVLAKHLYGGLGANLFNPAMVGYVVLLICFPGEMSQWLAPRAADIDRPQIGLSVNLTYVLSGRGLDVDAVTQATPLDLVRQGLRNSQTLDEIRVSPLFGSFGGTGWEWVNVFIGVGGLFLLYRGVIHWHIPVSLIAALFTVATLFYLIDSSRFPSAGFHLSSGATMLGAFFIATDPVSAATTDRGRLIYGAGIGFLTYAIRTWGGYADGVSFAVLLMNAAVPLIDRYTRPRIYGRL